MSATPALAFRAMENNVTDWATEAAFVGDFDGDGRSDVAGWTDITAAATAGRQEMDSESSGDSPMARIEPAGPLAGWRIWHSDGYTSTLNFTEYSHNLPAALTASSALLPADFDGDGRTDIGYWDGGAWQFLRSDGASGDAFSFSATSSNLGGLAGGDTAQILMGDFDGDGRTDLLGWTGSAWDARISQGGGAAFDFQAVGNSLGGLAGGDATTLIAGDFDGDGLTDIGARNAADTAWVVWQSTGLSGGALAFGQLNSSLSPDVAASAARRSADFNGDGRSDVLAAVGGAAEAWLGQGLASAMPFQAVANNVLQFSGQLLDSGLTGDFDGDGQADYASPDTAGTGWVFQLGGESSVRVVDDDYCAVCSNDGLTWGVDAFSDLQPALDAAWFADTLLVRPGVYGGATIHAGRDQLTIQGTDPDAVFIDAAGGTGLLVFPTGDQTIIYPDIRGVTLRNLT
ncbi:MAG: FG-GAP repeat domain-containing protein, partial [Anaerolineae bacterium]